MACCIIAELIGTRPADRPVETSRPPGFAHYIPKRDAARGQPVKPVLISNCIQRFSDRVPEKPPELVLRMGIIALCFE